MPSPSFLHSQVAKTLVKYRELKGLNQTDAAAFLGTSVEILRSYERGERGYMEPAMVAEWLRDYGAPQYVIDEAKAQCREIRFGDPSRWQNQGPEWLSRLTQLEPQASALDIYEGAYITGLLQTRAYASAIMDTNRTMPPDQKERALDFRAYRRRTVLENPDSSLRLRVIQAEQSLICMDGMPLFEDQLARMSEDSERDNVEIYVLPTQLFHPSMGGVYMIMSFDDPATPDVVYHEGPLGAQYEASKDQVARCRGVFSDTLALAVPLDEWKAERC
ncbi:Scr1 family TA system antitoxin-like transcriptional regulator [Glycomyces salinus]|uniref:Scr1 family TA system antitoxin-like transcriptional regulator n=1 Tax=Glycomyces salinus TaxID=980294 RepID=UPI0018ED28B7|nr:Scr1 family TA system antitoxin-like transcriptional regulator [Glycomyces salinus]